MKIPATIALVATLACPAAAQEARGTKFGIAFKPIDAVLSKTRKRVEITGAPSQDEPRYYRLRIKVTNPGNEDWSIVIRASTGQSSQHSTRKPPPAKQTPAAGRGA